MKYLGLGVSSEASAKINRLVQVKRDRKCWGVEISERESLKILINIRHIIQYFFHLYTTNQTRGSSQISPAKWPPIKLSFDVTIIEIGCILMDVWGGRQVRIDDLVISRQKCKPRCRWKTATLRTTSTINPMDLIFRHHHLNPSLRNSRM